MENNIAMWLEKLWPKGICHHLAPKNTLNISPTISPTNVRPTQPSTQQICYLIFLPIFITFFRSQEIPSPQTPRKKNTHMPHESEEKT